MRWYIIGRKAYYRTRCVVKVLFITLLLVAFSVSVVEARYDRELFLEAAGAGEPSRLVVIDAGHGGEDCGAIGTMGVYEKDLNMQISLEIGEALKSRGYTVVYTRTEDKLLYTSAENIKGLRKISDLKNRCKIANSYPDAIFISIHMNSYSEAKYQGLQVYYAESSPESSALAGKIQTNVRSRLQNDNKRQIKKGEGIYVLENTEPVSVLVECGFLTNDAECKKLCEKEYQKQLSFAIVCGIIEYNEGKVI